METDQRLLFDVEVPALMLRTEDDGFARRRLLSVSIDDGGGPLFDLEGAEANLTVEVIDSEGISVTESLRLRLTFDPLSTPDLPDLHPPVAPGPCAAHDRAAQ